MQRSACYRLSVHTCERLDTPNELTLYLKKKTTAGALLKVSCLRYLLLSFTLPHSETQHIFQTKGEKEAKTVLTENCKKKKK